MHHNPQMAWMMLSKFEVSRLVTLCKKQKEEAQLIVRTVQCQCHEKILKAHILPNWAQFWIEPKRPHSISLGHICHYTLILIWGYRPIIWQQGHWWNQIKQIYTHFFQICFDFWNCKLRLFSKCVSHLKKTSEFELVGLPLFSNDNYAPLNIRK